MNDDFIKTTLSLRGVEQGQKWLDGIPKTIKKYEEKWNIRVLPPFHLTYNYVAPAVRNSGEEVVLKIGYPGDVEIDYQIDALKIYNGEGSIRLLEEDKETAVMLLEKATPGTALRTITNDREASRIFVDTTRKLQKPIANNNSFPTVMDWAKGFERHKKNIKGLE